MIAPFILYMQGQHSLKEWEVWFIIFAFLACLITFSIWLVIRVYPPAIFSIDKDRISLSFNPGNSLSPTDFSFIISEIKSFTRGEIKGEEYFVFETRNPARKFQISPFSHKVEDLLSFNEAMVEISGMINAMDGMEAL
jgi:hypothetical protein